MYYDNFAYRNRRGLQSRNILVWVLYYDSHEMYAVQHSDVKPVSVLLS